MRAGQRIVSGMSEKPKLLDLFCGAGGAAVGYHHAGFEVYGIDHVEQPNYPSEFMRADAPEALERLCAGDEVFGYDGWGWAAIHASPPCQDYSKTMRHLSDPRPRLIGPTRRLLEATGVPWIIENVVGSPLPSQATLDGRYGAVLCGSMFGLKIRRHRLFEASFPIHAPRGCDHRAFAMNPHEQAGRDRITEEYGPGDQERPWREEMGVEWMGRYEARESIPPAFTEFLGHQLMQHIRAEQAA